MWFLAYFLLHLVIYTLLRAEFLIWNWASLKSLSSSDVVLAFLYGIRFDLSALAVTVGLCFLILPWIKNRLAQKLWLLLFILVNMIFFMINAVDVELFNFTAKRFTASSFYLVRDAHVSNLVTPYIPLASASFLIFGLYIFFSLNMIRKYTFSADLKKKISLSFAVLVVAVIFSRGGFQLKPLTFVDAKVFSNTYENNLILNSTFTVLKSSTKSSLRKVKNFEKDELLAQLNNQDIPPVSVDGKNLNIVVLILESFSEEYTLLRKPEATPFFNKLRQQGVDFTHAYANGRRSIEGIAAILSGIPALMEEPFINSEFSANQVIGLGSILAAHNYHTSFFHATVKGSMHFDSFIKSVGIENHFSQETYPDQNDKDSTWGIFDEPFLQWTCYKYNSFKPPFFSAIFTLSSHQPYELPTKYLSRFRDSRLDILKSVEYSDYSLEQFMKCAQEQSWYKNTVFILTADHTGPPLSDKGSFESRYQVPLVLFSPQKDLLKNIDPNQYAQHIDVLPTVLDLLKIEYKNKNYLSRSLLRTGPKLIALYSDGQYQLVGDVKDPVKQLKAVQQYFSEGLYDNRLYYPSK